jgi:hypothetical protein
MSTVQISVEDLARLIAADAKVAELEQRLAHETKLRTDTEQELAVERTAHNKTKLQLADQTRQREMWQFRAEKLREQLHEERLHPIMGSMYLHALDRGDKTDTTNLPKQPCKIEGTTLFLKPGVVKWNERNNERGRRNHYDRMFAGVNTIATVEKIYYIMACEKAVKEAFKSHGWMPIWGQEFFAQPIAQQELDQRRAVFLETTLPFTIKPSIDQIAPYPTWKDDDEDEDDEPLDELDEDE